MEEIRRTKIKEAMKETLNVYEKLDLNMTEIEIVSRSQNVAAKVTIAKKQLETEAEERLEEQQTPMKIKKEIEIDTSGYYLVRQGDGKNKFFDLPIIVNNARYEEILTLTQGYMNTVNNFSKNMTEATNSANSAAQTANDAAASATAGAKACEGIVDGLNTMVDTVTKKTCVLSIEDGTLTIREA